MLHVTVRQDVVEDGKLKTIELDRTVQELDEMPELAIGVLLQTIWERFFLIIHFGEGAKLCDELLKLQIEWVYRDPPLDKKVAYTLALQQDNSWDKGMALIRIKKSGRPVKSRHTAIKALFCKMYFGKSWQEVTQRFCQCGQSHDNKSPDNTLRFQACQGRLESEVRHLKKALKKCGVAFPPARIKGSKSPYQAGESSQSRSQDLRKTATLE